MRWGSRARAIIIAMCLAVGVAGCATAPSSENSILAFSDIEDDIERGREAHPEVLAQYGGAYDDPELQAYVEDVGNQLKSVSELAQIDFTFTVLDSDIVNAFALPGGYVYVSRGLLAFAVDEAELAGVLGHEIGHVTARHGAQAQTRGVLGQIGVVGATIAGAVLGGQAGAEIAQLGSSLVAQGIITSYSRAQEFEADKLGIRYLSRAEFDPDAMADFLRALEESAQLEAELAGVEPDAPGAFDHFFATHPNTPDRVARAQELAADEVASETRNPQAFYAAIDGVVFGESPDQGFVLGQEFAHPDLRFRFEVPRGFTLRNTPSAVIARGDERTIIFDIGPQDEADAARHLQRSWVPNIDLDEVRTFTTGRDFEGAIGVGSAQTQEGRLEGAFAVIEGEDRFYRFMLLTKDFGRGDQQAIEEVLDSFDRLSPEQARALEPLRIRVVTVESGDTIDSFVRRMEVEDLPREHFITLNGLDRDRELDVGDRVKILVRE